MKNKIKSKARTKEKLKLLIKNVRGYIRSSFNNTLVYITDINGNALTWASSGEQKFTGSRKCTPHAAGIATKAASERFYEVYYGKKNISIEDLSGLKICMDVFVKGPGNGNESAIRSFGAYFVVERISNITGIPHNGCRPKKERRV
jgi:small subunit ribosomal protein S11